MHWFSLDISNLLQLGLIPAASYFEVLTTALASFTNLLGFAWNPPTCDHALSCKLPSLLESLPSSVQRLLLRLPRTPTVHPPSICLTSYEARSGLDSIKEEEASEEDRTSGEEQHTKSELAAWSFQQVLQEMPDYEPLPVSLQYLAHI